MLTLEKFLMLVKHHGCLETIVLSVQWTIFMGQNNQKLILGELLI
jgi:hypothetical protein